MPKDEIRNLWTYDTKLKISTSSKSYSNLPGLKPKCCGKMMCIVPCYKIYYTEFDYKLHTQNFREGGLAVQVVVNGDWNDQV